MMCLKKQKISAFSKVELIFSTEILIFGNQDVETRMFYHECLFVIYFFFLYTQLMCVDMTMSCLSQLNKQFKMCILCNFFLFGYLFP